jgi:DNA polymerase-3 subunit delta
MLHLLLGKDIFAKQAYINDLAKQISAGQIWYGPESLPNLQNLLEPTLFQITQVVVFEGCLNNPDMFALLPSMQSSSDHFALVEEKLDKRKTEVTKLLKLNGLITNEFTVPREPRELSQWIITHAKNQSIEIQPEAALELVQRFGFGAPVSFDTPEPDVWQIHNELQKLATYHNGGVVSLESVKLLVTDQSLPQVWDIIEAIAQRKPAQVLTMLQTYLSADNVSDEKTKIIQLNALLADQFRSLLLVRSAQDQGIPEDVIIQTTGWKSGKLFMIKKNSRAFEQKTLVDILAKLEALDIELKTSSVPPKVLIDLISSQI